MSVICQFTEHLQETLNRIKKAQDIKLVQDQIEFIQARTEAIRRVNWQRADELESLLVEALTK